MKKIEYSIILLLGILYYHIYGGSFFRFLPATITEFLIIILASYVFFKKKERILFKKSHGLVLFLITIIFSSLLWTNAPIYGFSKVFYLLLTFILFYMISPIIYRNFSLFLKIQIVFYILYVFDLYLTYGFIDKLIAEMNIQFRLGWEEDITALFHPIGISRYLGMGILNTIFLVYFTKHNNKIIIIFFSILVLYGSVYLFFSGTRTPVLAIILSLLLFFLLNKYTKFKTKIIIILVPITLFSFFQLFLHMDFGWSKQQKDFIEYRYIDSASAIRGRSWQFNRATKNIDLNMALFGKGTGDFAYEFYGQDIREYPHNLFTEIFFENGIFPLIIIFWIILIVIYLNFQSKSKILNYFIILFYNALVNAMFSGDLVSNNFIFGYFLIILYINKKYTKVYSPKINKSTVLKYQEGYK